MNALMIHSVSRCFTYPYCIASNNVSCDVSNLVSIYLLAIDKFEASFKVASSGSYGFRHLKVQQH